MPETVILDNDAFAVIQQEAELRGRTVAEQLTHWILIGHAIEIGPEFDYAHVEQALHGQCDATELSNIEFLVWQHLCAQRTP